MSKVRNTKPKGSAVSKVRNTKPKGSAVGKVRNTKPYSSAMSKVRNTKPKCSAMSKVRNTKVFRKSYYIVLLCNCDHVVARSFLLVTIYEYIMITLIQLEQLKLRIKRKISS